MRLKKRSMFVRVMAVIIVALMVGGILAAAIPFYSSAADEEMLSYPITGYNPGKAGFDKPIPMIVIMINFDADGDGVDDNPTGKLEDYNAVKDKDNPAYGEQWCHTTEEDWVNILFSEEGNTLNTYYKFMSNDKFWWEPAKETYGTKDNGVIAVTIDNVHPNCNGVSANWLHCFKQIVEAASEYVDFSIYDTNKNGQVDTYELCLAFILGGAETSSGSTTMKEVYGFHAYYKAYDPNNVVKTDGVTVGQSGFFGTGAISGNGPLNFGVFAHELGHYLGAPDLYDTDGSKYDSAVGYASMMASGSHGSKPAHFDPYMLNSYGFYSYTTVSKDGEYTLYSKTSEKGDYNIIKIATPNPGEYFLIENRNSSIKDGSTFDGSITHGILIWHIDENIHSKTGDTCNSADHGLDPAVVVYTPIMKDTSTSSATAQYGAFVADHPTYSNYAVFKATSYTFPISKTWYTSMTAEEAKKVENLKVTVTSAKGDEMTVKIEGVYDPELEPEWNVVSSNVTKNSMTVTGILSTLNYCTLNSVKCELVDASTNKVVKTTDVALNKDYRFNVDYTDLTPGTNYLVKINSKIVKANATAESDGTATGEVYTLPDVQKTKAKVTINIGGDIRPSTTANVKVGDKVEISAALLKKAGHKLVGWYLDEALTTPFDITKAIESTDDFTIWAKWVPDASAATLTLVGAEADGFVYSAEAGGKFIEPTAKAKKGYTFGGWYADEAFATAFDFDAAVAGVGEVKIYAKWLDANGNVYDPAATTTGAVTTAPTATEPVGGTQGGGCGSAIASGAVVTTALLGLGLGLVRKKREE